MNYEFSTLCYVRFLSGVFAICLILLLWKHRKSRGALYLILFEMAAAIWAIGDGFEAAATTVSLKMFWAQISYIGINTSPVMFLMFALSYTNNTRYVNLKAILGLMVVPCITMLMAFTNSLHGLLWKSIIIIEGTNNSVYNYGLYFWFNIVYQYSLLSIGIFIMLIEAFKVFSIYKFQFWALIVAAVLPFIASISYVFKILPVKGIDPTPISFILTGVIVAASLYRLQLFSIMPIARKQAIDNLRDGMFIINSADRIVDVNPAFCRIIDLQTDQLVGIPAKGIFAKMNIDMDLFATEKEFVPEIQLGTKADLQYYEVKCHNVTDRNGELIGRIFNLTDVTTKKLILEAIADSNNSRRIHIIENEKLILELDAYARSVAHDLKNPVSSVISLCDLIQISLSEDNKDDVVEMVNMVRDQNLKMIRIIEGLLILSRVRREEIKQYPVEIRSILQEAMKRLKDEITLRKAEIDFPDNWPRVMGYNQWIEEVLVNLISNALKYGGRPPVIKMGFEEASPSSFRFWIRDNGNGLSTESLKKIFKDFERLEVKKIEGNGLGLTIVKRIIEKLGGEVSVSSPGKPGEGCEFCFTLKSEV
jgi:PAS domain S-box-containing protein